MMDSILYEASYLAALQDVLEFGEERVGRNGSTRSLFNVNIHADLSHSFPVLTTRKMHLKGVIGEFCAFASGSHFLKTFKDFGCNYWDANAKQWHVNEGKSVEDMLVGEYVGALWRNYDGEDQLDDLIKGLKSNPDGRRHVLTSWHPKGISALPPCTVMAIFYHMNGKLSCHVTQRSADMCLGVPSDFVVYGLLLAYISKLVGMRPDMLSFTLVDAHVYEKHLDQAYELTERQPHVPPALIVKDEVLAPARYLAPLPDNFAIVNYAHSPAINFDFVA